MTERVEVGKCTDCGKMLTKSEGGLVFTVCDDCFDNHYSSSFTDRSRRIEQTERERIEPSKEAVEAASRKLNPPFNCLLQEEAALVLEAAYAIDFAKHHEQLRLCNVDQANSEAENDQLRRELESSRLALQKAQKEPCKCACHRLPEHDSSESESMCRCYLYEKGSGMLCRHCTQLALQESQQRVKHLEEVLAGKPVLQTAWEQLIAERDQQQTALQGLAEALKKLANETSGCLSVAMRHGVGNTNFAILEQRVSEARSALTAASPWLRKEE